MGVIVWYEANQDYIASELCENKEKPQLHCNGKCYLKKQLNKVDDTRNDKQLPGKKVKSELPEYVVSSANFSTIAFPAETAPQNSIYNNLYTFEASYYIFHPPPVC